MNFFLFKQATDHQSNGRCTLPIHAGTGLSIPQSTTAHARPTYLSRCAMFTRLSVKPEYGGPITINATYKLAYYLKPVATNYDKTQQQQHHSPQIFVPQIFVPQNTPFENSAFCILHSTSSPSRNILASHEYAEINCWGGHCDDNCDCELTCWIRYFVVLSFGKIVIVYLCVYWVALTRATLPENVAAASRIFDSAPTQAGSPAAFYCRQLKTVQQRAEGSTDSGCLYELNISCILLFFAVSCYLIQGMIIQCYCRAEEISIVEESRRWCTRWCRRR